MVLVYSDAGCSAYPSKGHILRDRSSSICTILKRKDRVVKHPLSVLFVVFLNLAALAVPIKFVYTFSADPTSEELFAQFGIRVTLTENLIPPVK
jgi:hypothetical protein